MGTRRGFLGWVPYQGFGTPSFFHDGNLIGHSSRDRDRRASRELRSYGEEAVRQSGVPLGRTGGVLAGRSASRMDESPAAWWAVTGSCKRCTALVGEITRHGEDAGRGFAARRAAAAVASLNRWRGMLTRAKRRRFSGSISESASMKNSTVSSLA